MGFCKNGNVITNVFSEVNADNIVTSDMSTKVLSDGSYWARIFYHNNRAGTKLFNKTDDFANIPVMYDADRYSRLYLLKNLDPKNIYEMMVCQPDDGGGVWRWTQTNNPLNSYTAGTVTMISGDEILGLVKSNSGATFLANVESPTWWCAIGAWVNYVGGIPGFPGGGEVIIKGGLELWIRIDNMPNGFNIFKNFISSREFIEI